MKFIITLLIVLSCGSTNLVNYIDLSTQPYDIPTTQPFIFVPTTQPTIDDLQKQIRMLEVRIMLLEINQGFLKDCIRELLDIMSNNDVPMPKQKYRI